MTPFEELWSLQSDKVPELQRDVELLETRYETTEAEISLAGLGDRAGTASIVRLHVQQPVLQYADHLTFLRSSWQLLLLDVRLPSASREELHAVLASKDRHLTLEIVDSRGVRITVSTRHVVNRNAFPHGLPSGRLHLVFGSGDGDGAMMVSVPESARATA